jgi:hypothetical protein
MNRLRPLLLLLFTAPLFSFSQPRYCGIQWDDTYRVSLDSALSVRPLLSLDGDTVNILWFGLDTLGTLANAGIQYSHSFDGGQSFSPETTLVPQANALLPGLMSSVGSFVYVVFAASIDTFYGTALLRSSDAGLSWGSPVFLRSNALPSAVTAGDSRVYIQFQDAGNGPSGLLASTDHGVTWVVSPAGAPRLDVMVLTRSRIHGLNVQTSGTSREVGYFYSPDGGSTWIGPDIISQEDTTFSTLPSLAANERGDLVAIWNDAGSIVGRISRSEGASWSPQAVISAGRKAVFSSAAAANEFVAAIWDNDFGGYGGIGLKESSNEGLAYCPEERPTQGTAVGEPAAAIFNNLLHAVWSEAVGADKEILYRRGALTENPEFAPGPPKLFVLKQNFPNPFNDATEISYDLPKESHVTLVLYNVLGQEVIRLVDGVQPAQRYSVVFEAGAYPTGVYFYRLKTDFSAETRKFIIAR